MNSILIANGGVQVAPPPTVAFIYLKKILEFGGGGVAEACKYLV
jgi:hypothetical protein